MNNKPIWKVRAGSVSAAMWSRDVTVGSRSVKMLSVSIERRYRDNEGNWKSSNSFSRNEIPLATYCLEKAFDQLIERSGEDDSNPEEVVQ